MAINRFVNCLSYLFLSVVCLLFFACATLIFPVPQAEARGVEASHLMLDPVRLIFNGRDRTAQLSVVNAGKEEVRYSVSVIPLRKEQNGEWVRPKKTLPEDKKISNMIRYSPRRAKIAPRTEQVVRFMLRKPANLPAGEYRARIVLSPIPEEKKEKQQNSAEQTLSIDIGLQVQSSFPIVIQHNIELPTVTPVSITLPNDSDDLSKKTVDIICERQGQYSSFGDISLLYSSLKRGSKWRKIGSARGVAIYSPEKQRNISIALHDITREELQAGVLRLEYRHNNGRAKAKKEPDSVRDFRL